MASLMVTTTILGSHWIEYAFGTPLEIRDLDLCYIFIHSSTVHETCPLDTMTQTCIHNGIHNMGYAITTRKGTGCARHTLMVGPVENLGGANGTLIFERILCNVIQQPPRPTALPPEQGAASKWT